MGATEEAVRQRLARARKTLKGRLDREFGGASGTWALAILGSVPVDRIAAASGSAGAATATAASTGSTVFTGMKLAAACGAVFGAVAVWRDELDVRT